MSAKARQIEVVLDNPEPTPTNDTSVFNEVALLAVPTPVLKKLSDFGAARNMTAAQVLGQAIDQYMRAPAKTESAGPTGPRLLTED